MSAVGIIAEYNPFHKGHLYHLTEAKRQTGCDTAVAVMSGNFMQRGEMAMADKWIRAEVAVRNGVDLVLELPFVYACNSAEYFAKGAMAILKGLENYIMCISFGSEDGDLDTLVKTAKLLSNESNDFKRELELNLKKGTSYPKARYEALAKCYGAKTAKAIQQPNNILAVEYIKQSIFFDWDVKFCAIKRKGAGYLDPDLTLEPVSATGIRRKFAEKEKYEEILGYLPDESAKVFERKKDEIYTKTDNFFLFLAYKAAITEAKDLADIFSAGEGLENKIKKAFLSEIDLESVISNIKSKRYTETRIRRLLTHTLFGLEKKDMDHIIKNNLIYTRVLGFSDKGAALLRKIKKDESSSLPIITNINKEVLKDDVFLPLTKWDLLATDLFNLINRRDMYKNSDHLIKPYIKG